MADAGPGALGQDATQIESSARSGADNSRLQAAPDYSPLKGAKLVSHADAKANLRAQLQSELQHEGIDTGALSDTRPSPIDSGPPPGALAGSADDGAGPQLAENASNPVVSHNIVAPPPSAMEAIGDSAKATGKELYNGLARGALGVANGLGFATVGSMHLATSPFRTAGMMSDATQADADQKVFDFLHNYVDTAKQFWTVPDSESNPYAKGVGEAAETLAPLVGGEAGVPAMIASAAMDKGKDVIDTRANETAHELTLDAIANGTYNAQARREGAGAAQGVPEGEDVTTAVTLAIIAAGTNALSMKLPLKNPSVIKRIATAVGLGVPLNSATDLATKMILKNRGFQSAADKIDPVDPSSIIKSGIMQTVFGILGEKGNAAKIREAQGATPPKAARVEPYIGDGSGTPPPAPPAPAAEGTPQSNVVPPPALTAATGASPSSPAAPPVSGGAAAPVSKIPDKPTAEPVSDLRAQFKDMGNSATPRNGVFISTDNAANLKGADSADKIAINNQIQRAVKENRVVDTGNGQLIVKSKKLADDAATRIKNGEDPQSVIGELTGAGSGKRPDQSHVVQGKDTKGNVVTETSVAPHEIPAAVAHTEGQGNEAVITTPQEAVERRAQMVQAENATEQASTEPKATTPAEAPTPEPTTPLAPAEPKVEEAPPAKPASEPQAVEQKGPETPPAAEPAAEKPKTGKAQKPKTGMESLQSALTQHELLDTPRDGRKFATSLKERSDNASSFAQVLKQAADEVSETRPEDSARAAAAAKAMIGLTDKSDNAVVKGQGVSHTRLDALTDEAHKAARILLEKPNPGDEIKTVAKEVELKAKVAKAKSKPVSAESLPDVVTPEHIKQARQILEDKEKLLRMQRHVGNPVTEAKNEAAAAKARLTALETKAKGQGTKVVAAKKPVKATIGEKEQAELARKMAKFTEEYKSAETPKEAIDKRHEIEQWMNEMGEHDDRFTPDQIHSVLHWLDTERDAANKGKKPAATMGDTLEDEEHVHDKKELADSGMSVIHRALSGVKFLGEAASEKLRRIQSDAAVNRLKQEWGDLAKLHSTRGSALEQLRDAMDSGDYASSHNLMKAILADHESAKVAPHVYGFIMKLAHVAPDVPVFSRSAGNFVTTDSRGNFARGDYGGLATTTRSATRMALKGMTAEQRAQHMAQNVQIDMTRGGNVGYQLATLMHELWHTATAYELDNNPTGEFANEMDKAHQALVTRMKNKYGEDVINDHIAYFNGGGGDQKPAGYNPNLYGLTNSKEMVAEAMGSNPAFMHEIIDSENHAMPNEDLNYGITQGKTLIEKILGAIGKLFGVQDPKLMKHIMQLSMDVGSEQKKHFGWFQNTNADVQAQRLPEGWKRNLAGDTSSPLEEARAAAGLRNLAEPAQDLEPKWLETEMNASIRQADPRAANDPDPSKPDSVIGATRNWMHTTGGKSLDAIRTTKMWLKSWDQILRDHVKDFGTDDATNPLRQLQEVKGQKEEIMHRLRNISRNAATLWSKLTPDESLSVSKIMRDSTNWSIDPRLEKDEQSAGAKSNKAFDTMFDQISNAYDKLPQHVKDVYEAVTDLNARLQDERRKAGIDTAVHTFDTSAVDPKALAKLYDVRHPSEYDRLVGKGLPIDIGDDNDKLLESLKDFSTAQMIDGPYHHLGRQGEYVVQPEREGTKSFDDKAKADKFAELARTMSPDSKATVREGGGAHHVDYEIQYTSMHETEHEANAEKDKLNAAGFETGNVTRKTTDQQNAPLSYGMKELLAEAERKLSKGVGDPKEIEAQVAALRSSFLQIQAARSAYAGSRLARRNFGGVLAKDMRRNFSDHTMSTIWHIGQMRTVFDEAKAMAAIRTAARDRTLSSQKIGLRRGEVAKILNARGLDEVANMGNKSPLNTVLAKLGYYRYLASPSHALIWMTQNPTAGAAIAGAKWGYGRSALSIARTGALAVGPAMRQTMREAFRAGGNSEAIHEAVLSQIAKSKRYAQYVPQIKVMMERGVISHSYADEMTKLQQSQGNTRIGRATDLALQWARMLPSMADAVNRMSSALTGLELTGGDVRQATDYVNQTHADYSSDNKPMLFKKISRVPGGNTITAFMTYQQNMMHLLYGNIAASFKGERKLEAAKTVAGLMMANSIFAGVYAGSAIIPVQLGFYAYGKLQKEGEVTDLKTAIHHFLVDHFGEGLGNTLAYGPVAHGLGINLSSRMGLADLFFRDMPDLLNGDLGAWKDFIFDHSGTFISDMANSVTASSKAMGQGDIKGALGPWVPFKIYQDSVKAAGLWEDGKRNGYGSQLTEPSGLDAIKQIIGFQPESVERASEKQRVSHLFSAAHSQVRDELSKAYVSAQSDADRSAALDRIKAYNQRNPSNPIKGGDLRSTEKFKVRTELDLNKDQRAKAATTF